MQFFHLQSKSFSDSIPKLRIEKDASEKLIGIFLALIKEQMFKCKPYTR